MQLNVYSIFAPHPTPLRRSIKAFVPGQVKVTAPRLFPFVYSVASKPVRDCAPAPRFLCDAASKSVRAYMILPSQSVVLPEEAENIAASRRNTDGGAIPLAEATRKDEPIYR